MGEWVPADRPYATHLQHEARGVVVTIEGATSTRDLGHGRTYSEDFVDRGHPGWRRVKWCAQKGGAVPKPRKGE